MYPLLRILAALKLLRGTAFDVFGWAAIRRQERELIAWYRGIIETLLASLTSDNWDAAVEIAGLADKIRGYEHVKLASIAKVRQEAEEKLSAATRRPAA